MLLSVLLGWSFSIAFYAFLVPAILIIAFALLFIPSILTPGARPLGIGKAIYCYGLQMFGIFLMTIAGLPALYAVLEKIISGYDRFPAEVYVALLLTFTGGGLTFLWHEHMAETIEEPSRRVTASIFWFVFKLIGYTTMIASALSFFAVLLLIHETFTGTWWISPILLFLYGMLLSWCTRLASPSDRFRPLPMMAPPSSVPVLTAKTSFATAKTSGSMPTKSSVPAKKTEKKAAPAAKKSSKKNPFGM